MMRQLAEPGWGGVGQKPYPVLQDNIGRSRTLIYRRVELYGP